MALHRGFLVFIIGHILPHRRLAPKSVLFQVLAAAIGETSFHSEVQCFFWVHRGGRCYGLCDVFDVYLAPRMTRLMAKTSTCLKTVIG